MTFKLRVATRARNASELSEVSRDYKRWLLVNYKRLLFRFELLMAASPLAKKRYCHYDFKPLSSMHHDWWLDDSVGCERSWEALFYPLRVGCPPVSFLHPLSWLAAHVLLFPRIPASAGEKDNGRMQLLQM